MSFKKILGAVRKADVDFDLIRDGDRIAVGVSGGKDSLLLLEALYRYQLIARRYDQKGFEILGLHLEMGFPDMDFKPVRDYMEAHHIPYVDYPTRLYDILKLHPTSSRSVDCSLCSKLKKGAIVKAAKEYRCNKIAFAHHADDAIETLFLNMIYGGRIRTFEPAMHLSNSGMDFIRPFIYCFEADIREAAVNELKLPIVQSTCPNDGFTKREAVKDLLKALYSQYPQAQRNFLGSLSNTDQTMLWIKNLDWKKRES